MANVLSFDSFVRKRKEAALAEAQAQEAFRLAAEGVATKADLAELEARLDAEIARIRAEFKADIAELKAMVAAIERHVLLTVIALYAVVAMILKMS